MNGDRQTDTCHTARKTCHSDTRTWLHYMAIDCTPLKSPTWLVRNSKTPSEAITTKTSWATTLRTIISGTGEWMDGLEGWDACIRDDTRTQTGKKEKKGQPSIHPSRPSHTQTNTTRPKRLAIRPFHPPTSIDAQLLRNRIAQAAGECRPRVFAVLAPDPGRVAGLVDVLACWFGLDVCIVWRKGD